MDQSAYLCEIYDSFEGRRKITSELQKKTPIPLSLNTQSLTPYSSLFNLSINTSLYVDNSKYTTFLEKQKLTSDPSFNKFKKLNDIRIPQKKPNYEFYNLCSIDCSYNIFGIVLSSDIKQIYIESKYCIIGSGNGIEYIQFRYPWFDGVGMISNPNNININPQYFYDYKGYDNSGNVSDNMYDLINLIISQEPTGIQLFISDNYNSETEIKNNILIALAILKTSGNACIKIGHPINHFYAQILYIVASCFQSITIFKPCTSSFSNDEHYLICWSYKSIEISKKYFEILKNSDQYFFNEPMDPQYISWLTNTNNMFLDNYISYLEKVEKKDTNLITKYNFHALMEIWNL